MLHQVNYIMPNNSCTISQCSCHHARNKRWMLHLMKCTPCNIAKYQWRRIIWFTINNRYFIFMIFNFSGFAKYYIGKVDMVYHFFFPLRKNVDILVKIHSFDYGQIHCTSKHIICICFHNKQDILSYSYLIKFHTWNDKCT